ncbi:MAG: hypothetical protein U0R78_05415 [Nocardioidaceae bacterium]
MGLPTNPAATSSVADPALASLLQVRDSAPYVQLYFDTAFGASVGGAMNDEIALMFAGGEPSRTSSTRRRRQPTPRSDACRRGPT